MHWELSDEQDLYAASLREWLEEHADPQNVRQWLDLGHGAAFEQHLVKEGWAGVGFDESIGGQGGGVLELSLTARELGRVAAPSSSWLQSAIAAPVLSHDPELASAAIESGEPTVFACRADQIPGMNSSVNSTGSRITGRVPCVLGAAHARRFIVAVDEPPGPVLMIVDRDADGLEVKPRGLLDRSREAADVIFDSVAFRRIDLDVPLTLQAVASRAAVLVAADALGTAERMLALSVEYSKQRKQFGQPIGAFQAVKHAAAQMLVTVESSFSLAFYAAASVDEGLAESPSHAAAAKAQVTEGCARLADDALTLHGAIGYTWEHDLHLYYKRAKLDRVLFGTPEEWNERVAASLPLLPAAR
jgi:alkylation response protein AidB-like acyl-CoA dehydrogenase